MDIRNELKKIILDVNEKIDDKEKLLDSQSIINDFGFDSVTLFTLVIKIEDKFNIEIDDEDLDIDRLDNIGSLINIIEKKIL